jgi:hypothetical protein
MGGHFPAEVPGAEMVPLPYRLLSRGREHGSGRPELGARKRTWWGVLPTLLPKRRNAEPVKNQNMLICRANTDGPSGTRTQDLGIKSPLLYQLS